MLINVYSVDQDGVIYAKTTTLFCTIGTCFETLNGDWYKSCCEIKFVVLIFALVNSFDMAEKIMKELLRCIYLIYKFRVNKKAFKFRFLFNLRATCKVIRNKSFLNIII